MSSVPVSGAVSSLQWVQLVFFALEAPVMTYNLITHGQSGSLGWFFMQNVCLLRTIGYILVKTAASVKVGSILSQVALSTMYFGFFGIWHECTSSTGYKRPLLFGWKIQIALHLIVATATGLIVSGAVQAMSNAPTPSNPKPGDSIVIAGISLFFVNLAALAVLLVVLHKTPGKLNLERKLLLVLTLCTPLLGIRTLYSLLGAAIDDSSWGFLTGGTIAEQVFLAVLPEFIIFISLSVAGIMTRHLAKELKASKSGHRNASSNRNEYGLIRRS